MGKLVIFSAPSGSGKTTIVRELLQRFPRLEFSVSATSRAPRGKERNGVDYFFLSPEEFRQAVQEDKFVEWEEVYSGTCYGTLRSEMERIWQKGNVIVFDVDVIGGLNLKRIFSDRACAIFIMPPSIETLRERLVKRGTDSPETIECRVAKASSNSPKLPNSTMWSSTTTLPRPSRRRPASSRIFSPDRIPAGKTRSKSDGYDSEPVPVLFADHSRPGRNRTKKINDKTNNTVKHVMLYFGSFNPIHKGHIALAEYAIEKGLCDEVVLVVSPQNPLKPAGQQAPELDRFSMAETACAASKYPDKIKPSVIEFMLDKPSYTIHTLRHLTENYGTQMRFSILMGDDLVPQLPEWKQYREIIDNYPIFVYPRTGQPLPDLGGRITLLEGAPLYPYSSSEIRERLGRGEDVGNMLPEG